METLTVLFGSQARVKLLRLFLFNPDTPFFFSEIAARTQTVPRLARRELAALEKADIIRKKRHVAKEDVNSGKRLAVRAPRGIGYFLNASYPHLTPLKDLMAVSMPQADDALLRRFAHIGKATLIVAAGIFIRSWDSRVDLLIVGDDLTIPKIEAAIRGIEAELGKEVAYSVFDTAEFEYRLGIHDRLIRDILDYPHVALIDRLGVEPR